MNIHPLWHLGVSLARDGPTAVVELVTTVVGRRDLQQDDVFRSRVKAGDAEF